MFASEHNTKTITQYQALVKNYIRERSERKIFQGFLQVHLTKKSDLGQKSPKSPHRQFVSEFEKLSPKSSKFQAFTSFAPDRSNTKPEKNPPPITSLSYYFSISDKSAKFPKKIPKNPLLLEKICATHRWSKTLKNFCIGFISHKSST